MKRTEKIWLIVAAALVLAGALCMAGILSSRHWDLASFGTVETVEQSFDIDEPFDSISLRSDTEDILFLPAQDGKTRVEFREPENVVPFAEVQDGTLLVFTEDTGKWTDRIGFSMNADPTITVYLPAAACSSLSVQEETGRIIVQKDFTFDRIVLSATTGDVFCYASAKEALRIGTDTGNIAIMDLSAGSVELSVTTGLVTVSGISCQGDMNVTVDTGKTDLSNVTCRNFVSKGDTGRMNLENLTASEKIMIERTTGDVVFSGCDAAELSVLTDTGDVKGTLRSDKVFIVRTDTGDIDVPETVSGGKCEIRSDSGDIKIKIAA
ncbi:MAG: DUF4097 family beta strand repeat protein [Clostridia bacterium]|nr:DUF4097 family beta strand repeat protein [Clostridia bacterium]